MSLLSDLFGKGSGAASASGAVARKPEPKSWTFNARDLYGSGLGSIMEVATSMHPGTYGLDYTTLQAMSRVPVVAAIINTRINQLAEFCVPQPDPYSAGFKIRMRDKEATATPAARKRINDIERICLEAGGEWGYGGFEPAMRAMMRDSLVYDQANFELLRTRGGQVRGLLPIDAATIRRARHTDKEAEKGHKNPYAKQQYVQIISNKIVNEYSNEDLAWCIRRPRTWTNINGYGFPELEELVRVVTDVLNAQTWNSVNFSNGVNASTILAIKSTMSAEVFEAFQRQMTSMMQGARNAHRVPIVQLSPEFNEEIKPVSLRSAAKDAEYTQWMGYLIKVICSVYLMDPAELGFIFGSEGQANSLVAAGPSERIVASKERGLRPLLRSMAHWLNSNFVHAIDPDFQLEFIGLDLLSEQQRVDLDIKALKAYRTINEIRANHDLDPIDSDLANMVLDSTYIQYAMMDKQQQNAEDFDQEDFDQEDAGAPENTPEEPQKGGLGSLTENLVKSAESRLSDGRMTMKGARTSSRRKAVVPLSSKPGARAYIVEVD